MKRIVRLTESDLTRIVRRVIREEAEGFNSANAAKLYKIFLSQSGDGGETIYATNNPEQIKFTPKGSNRGKKLFEVTGTFDYYSKTIGFGSEWSKSSGNAETFYVRCDYPNSVSEDEYDFPGRFVDRNGQFQSLVQKYCTKG